MNFLYKLSNILRRADDVGGTIFLSCITGVTTLYWRLDAKDYPNAGWVLKLVSEKWIAVILCVSILGIFSLSINKKFRDKSYKKLEKEFNEATFKLDKVSENIYNMFDGVMLSLSQRFDFENNTKARLSLYVNDEDKERFVPCGRYSPDPVLRKKGRSSFSHGQGCIWKCWKNDFHFDNNIPNAKKAKQTYNRKEYDIPQDTYKVLKMQPRLISGKRISDPMGNELGVVILEAMNPDQFIEEDVSSKFERSSDELGRLILTLKEYIPIPSDAEDVGL